MVVGFKNIIALSDGNCIVRVWQLEAATSPSFRTKTLLFQTSTHSTIRQVLFSSSQSSLLVSTTEAACVYDLPNSSCVRTHDLRSAALHPLKWFSTVSSDGEEEFALVFRDRLKRYLVTAFPELSVQQTLQLGRSKEEISNEGIIERVVYDAESCALILDTRHLVGFEPHATLSLFKLQISTDSDTGKTLRRR